MAFNYDDHDDNDSRGTPPEPFLDWADYDAYTEASEKDD